MLVISMGRKETEKSKTEIFSELSKNVLVFGNVFANSSKISEKTNVAPQKVAETPK